jgi:hypothetical protein
MRAAVVALIAALVLSSCGGDGERRAAAAVAAPTGMTRFTDERRGFEVIFPSDWRRADTVLTPNLTAPLEILSVGTVDPVPNGASSACAQHPVATLERLGPRDVFVTIQERANTVSGEMRPGPPELDAAEPDDSELPACIGHGVPFRTYWMPFEMGGRGFYANAAVGDEVPPERRAQLQAVLDSFTPRAIRVEDDRQRGVRFSYPEPWRIYPFQLTGVELRHQIALGTFPLEQAEPDANCSPASALAARGEHGGLLFVFEYADLNETQKHRFPRRPVRFELSELDPVAYECFGLSYLIRWRELVSDRAFQAHVYGPRRWVEQALGILDSFDVSKQGE